MENAQNIQFKLNFCQIHWKCSTVAHWFVYLCRVRSLNFSLFLSFSIFSFWITDIAKRDDILYWIFTLIQQNLLSSKCDWVLRCLRRPLLFECGNISKYNFKDMRSHRQSPLTEYWYRQFWYLKLMLLQVGKRISEISFNDINIKRKM